MKLCTKSSLLICRSTSFRSVTRNAMPMALSSPMADIFGGRFVVAPNARLEKPSFDICYSTRGGRAATLQYLVSMIRGNLPNRPDFEITSAPSLFISGPKGAPVQADGDIVTYLPAKISIQPNAVELLFPKEHAEGMAP